MLGTKYIPLVLKQVTRQRMRSLLTAAGVGMAMFLFCAVQAMQRGVREATSASASETTLVVYRENRFCPFTSRLPEHYETRIEKIPHVTGVIPIKIFVNNCRASLDVITFRGVPEHAIERLKLDVAEGSLAGWRGRGDGALVGENLAARRGLKVGESFDVAGITVYVAGIVRSTHAQDQNVAYVQLPFLQQASKKGGLGVVTQFNVKVDEPGNLQVVARAIDVEFANDQEPTYTSPEQAFIARAAGDIIEIVSFTKWLGWASLAAVLALVGNAIVLSVQDRVKEHAILQTLGFRGGLLARLIVAEGLALSVAGGLVGTLAAATALRLGRFTMTVEGVNVSVSSDPAVVGVGLAVAAALGILAGLVPAWQASRREIAQCFRAV